MSKKHGSLAKAGKVRKATKKVEKQPPKEGVPKAGRAKLRRKFIKQTNQKKAGKGKGRK